MRFTKMQAYGNDYVYIDAIHQELPSLPDLARFVSDRHFAIGSDGMVLICPSEVADFRMRMFNPDGSEGEMCGNAVRSVGKYVYDHRLTDKEHVRIETLGGIKDLWFEVTDGYVSNITANIGAPGLDTKVIPVTTKEYGLSKAARPFNSRLDKSKLVKNGFTPLPTWQDALSRYLKEIG